MIQAVYPGFLWGLVAVAIPVFIHLLQLRRPQRVLFTNTGFIREVELTTNRQRRLQELLVLLVRVLAVIALVGLFCQPYLPAKKQLTAGDTTIAVLVDDSPSMQALGTTQASVLEEALMGARALGKSYGASGRFQLVNQPAIPLSLAAYDTKLAALQGATGKAGWQELSTRYLAKASAQQPLYLFSDFQKNTQYQRESFFKNIPAGKEIVLVPQVARQSGNAYVDSVWLEDAFIRKGVNLGLHIRLHNGGSKQLADCPVKVFLGAQQVAAFRATIGAGQANTVVVQVQLSGAKLALGRVVTEDAPVTFDNSYYFTLQPAAAIQVLEIGDAPVAQRAYASEPLFTYTFAKPQQVNYAKLHQANLVLVNEVLLFNAGLRDALAQVAQQGGSVVVIPTGKVTSQESYHQLFKALGIGGEQWNAVGGPPTQQEMAMPSRQNPFFKDVLGAQPRQAAMPQAAAVLRWGRNGTDILRLRDGDSYLTEFASGAGRVYVFASPLDKAYSDFASHALFVPVLYRLAMLSYRNDQHLAYSLTEPTVTLTVPRSSGEQPAGAEAGFKLVRDSAVFVPAQRIQGAEAHLDIPSGLRAPGFYEVRQQGKLVTTLAFNADRRESELAAYSVAELRALAGPNRPNVHVLDDGAQPAAIARYRAEQTGQPLWRYCLALALGCLLAEGLLLRFGRPKAPKVARPLAAA